MTDKQPELLPCPFCGGKPLDKPVQMAHQPAHIRCSKCCCSMPVAQWNTRPSAQAIRDEAWNIIESVPKGRAVLVYYKNSLGKGRTVKASYIEKFTEEATEECDFGEYCEERDIYCWPEGWYEQIDNWDEFTGVAMSNIPTHWMPLPQPPQSTPDLESDK